MLVSSIQADDLGQMSDAFIGALSRQTMLRPGRLLLDIHHIDLTIL